MMRQNILGTILVVFTMLFSVPAYAKSEISTGLFSNLAVSGYDTVAYFTQGQPVKGVAEFSTEWKGAEWQFSSADNLAKFKANPTKYAPQYGGYCAYAAAANKAVSTDPKQWDIRNGKLYLNYSAAVRKDWRKDADGYIARADKNWPGLLSN